MTRITHLCLMALIFVFTNSLAKTINPINNSGSNYAYSNIQRVRIDFTMPDGFTRHLLLAFTKDNSASDNYDYGYDAINKDSYPYDLNWLVDNQHCTIQGVGAFDDSKKYPFWMFMSKDGTIEIALDTLENFDTPIDLFIYDSELGTYTQINDSKYVAKILKGEYLNRFYLVFKDDNTANKIENSSLHTDENKLEDSKVSYLKNTQELYINTNDNFTIKNINVFNLLGQEIVSLSHVNSTLIKIPLQTNKTKFGIVIIETEQGGFFSKKIAIN
jgi:hypothetical protein